MKPPGSASLAGRWICVTGDGGWSTFPRLLCSGPAHAFASEFDAVGVVDETVEDRVGVCGIADDFVPSVDGKLGGDHRGAASVALFKDFQQIVSGSGIERLQTPIIEDQKIGTSEIAQETRMATVAARQREILEQPGHALIEDRAIVATGLVAEGRG